MALFKVCDVSFEELLTLDKSSIRELLPSKTTIDKERFNRLSKYSEKVKLARNYPGFTFLYHYKEYQQSDSEQQSYKQFMEHYNHKNSKVKSIEFICLDIFLLQKTDHHYSKVSIGNLSFQFSGNFPFVPP